ncbi:MAG TPA: class I SAM-dependent methyltransferase [Anaerolineaceae bacterium]|nr:class I SAM-dependent methyltransferase [Anaerolineaceae bacterium]
MEKRKYTQANKLAWDAAAPVHAQVKLANLLVDVQTPGYSCLDPIETGIFLRIGLQGKSVAQLCCNNGLELISVKNLGANECVGFDISSAFIDQARQLAAAGHFDCEFVESDVLEIPEQYHHRFELVFFTIGALGWIPDLGLLFDTVRSLMKPGGCLFIYEMHPILDMFEGEDHNDPPALKDSYFREEPFIEETGLDYFHFSEYQSPKTYWFHHKLADVIGECIRQGFRLDFFEEYPHDISNVYRHFENIHARLPLCYALAGRLDG